MGSLTDILTSVWFLTIPGYFLAHHALFCVGGRLEERVRTSAADLVSGFGLLASGLLCSFLLDDHRLASELAVHASRLQVLVAPVLGSATTVVVLAALLKVSPDSSLATDVLAAVLAVGLNPVVVAIMLFA